MSRELAVDVLQALQDWRVEHRDNFPGVVLLSVFDSRNLDEDEQRRHRLSENSFVVPSRLKVGDEFFIWGTRARVADIDPGTFELDLWNV